METSSCSGIRCEKALSIVIPSSLCRSCLPRVGSDTRCRYCELHGLTEAANQRASLLGIGCEFGVIRSMTYTVLDSSLLKKTCTD